MLNIAFNEQEMQRLRTLLDIAPNQEPTAAHILAALDRGAGRVEAALHQLSERRGDTGRSKIDPAAVALFVARQFEHLDHVGHHGLPLGSRRQCRLHGGVFLRRQ